MVTPVEQAQFQQPSLTQASQPAKSTKWGFRTVMPLAMTAVAVVALASLVPGAAAQTYWQAEECGYDNLGRYICWMKECHLEEVCTHFFWSVSCHLEEVCTHFV